MYIQYRLPETGIASETIPKGNESSNHPCLGAMLLLGRVYVYIYIEREREREKERKRERDEK